MLISCADVAKMLGVSDRYIRRLCKNGKLPSVKVAGVWLVKKADAERMKKC